MENNQSLIEIEISKIKASIDKIKELCEVKTEAYGIKKDLEKYLNNKLFYFFAFN